MIPLKAHKSSVFLLVAVAVPAAGAVVVAVAVAVAVAEYPAISCPSQLPK